jgi:hypothetical protein
VSEYRKQDEGKKEGRQAMEQRQHLALLDFFKLSLELGSGKFSRVTKCITVVLFTGRLSAFNVTLPCKNRP